MPKKNKYVNVTIELEESTLWFLFNEAHRRDVTLNQLVNDLLLKYIEELENVNAKSPKNRVRRSPRVR